MPHPSSCHEKSAPDECSSCERTCLERPRYFCGQLLTEEDLNAEQRYQKEKNRLHNRFLHGWGVVCGLKVTCHPKCSSKGNVLVEKGYAIDCCGNDILVCRDEPFDLLKMIDKRRPKPDEDECVPGTSTPIGECEGLEKKYCLILKYKEEEARPVTALKKDDQGCSVKRCEPSRIREGYEFDVKECDDCEGSGKKSWTDIFKEKDNAFGKIEECLSILPDKPFGKGEKIDPGNHNQLLKIYCQAKDHILSKTKTNAHLVHCDIRSELDEIEFPSPAAMDDETYKEKVTDVYRKLGAVLFQLVLDCICLNLLYPCPEGKEDDKVVLACVTVKGDNIKDICNLSRRQVMTFPKLFYWLPINEMVREGMNNICCELDFLDLFKKAPSLPKIPQNNFAAVTMPVNAMKLSADQVFKDLVSNFMVPEGLGTSAIYNKSVGDAVSILEDNKITVKKEIPFEPSPEKLSLKKLFSTPLIIPPGSEVVLEVSSDNKVVGVKFHEEVEKVDIETIRDVVRKLDTLRTEVNVMRSSMRRDLDSTIKLKTHLEEAYQPLTINLVRALTGKMKPVKIREVGDVREGELKKAGMKSVRDVLEAIPAEVSDATGEPVTIATRYIDHAEELAIEVAIGVHDELKKANVKEKKDLNKVDAKSLAKKLKLPERIVKEIFDEILAGR